MFMSMTGYGSSTQTYHGSRGSLEVGVDIKTVNSKYLDISIRSPRSYMDFDPEIQRFVRSRLKRGRIDVQITMKVLQGKARELILNLEQAASLKQAYERVSEKLELTGAVTLADLLKFPDWIQSEDSSIDAEEEWKFVRRSVEVALNELLSSRLEEGRSLEGVIVQHRKRFGEVFEKIVGEHDRLQAQLRDRSRERLKTLFASEGFDPHRLEQEIVLWVQRADFQEEMDRITHHLKTFDDLLQGEGEVGRKFEFLVQELHREVNTLGSKCPDASVTPQIIELKVCIERIREQIQNVE